MAYMQNMADYYRMVEYPRFPTDGQAAANHMYSHATQMYSHMHRPTDGHRVVPQRMLEPQNVDVRRMYEPPRFVHTSGTPRVGLHSVRTGSETAKVDSHTVRVDSHSEGIDSHCDSHNMQVGDSQRLEVQRIIEVPMDEHVKIEEDVEQFHKHDNQSDRAKGRKNPRPKPKPPHGSFKCDVCCKVFANGNSLRTHMRNHTEEKQHKCSVCDKAFIFKHELKNHFYTHTDVPKPHQCTICNKSFLRIHRLEEHMKAHAGIKENECDICGEAFVRKAGLRRHKLKHSNVKPFPCEICGKSFYSAYELKTHTQMSHVSESGDGVAGAIKCEECKKIFQSQYRLKEHMRKHTGQRPHVCEFCGLAFAKGPILAKHVQIHMRGGEYTCDICGDVFKIADDLKVHWKTHAQGLTCDKCGKKFSRLPNYIKHKAKCLGTHCDICGEEFGVWSMMKDKEKHFQMHIDQGEECKCFICDEVVGDVGSLKTHLQKKHGDGMTCGKCGKLFTRPKNFKNHKDMCNGIVNNVNMDIKPVVDTDSKERSLSHYSMPPLEEGETMKCSESGDGVAVKTEIDENDDSDDDDSDSDFEVVQVTFGE